MKAAKRYTFPLVGFVAPCGCEWRRDPQLAEEASSRNYYQDIPAKPAGWVFCPEHNENDHPARPA